jgi:hypothetical protein
MTPKTRRKTIISELERSDGPAAENEAHQNDDDP